MSHTADDHGGHPPYLQHHFDTPEQQFDSSKLGMWLFLSTEVLLFGGLFVAYSVYRSIHPEVFAYAHEFLDWKLGAINTVILLVSSLTMAWAVRAAQLGQQRLLVGLLAATVACGGGFMSIKYVEYRAKFDHGLLWGQRYAPHGDEHASAVAAAATGGEGHAAAPSESSGGTSVPAVPGAPAAPAAPAGSATFVPERTLLAPPHAAPAGLAAVTHADEHPPEPHNVQVFFGIYFLMTGLHGLHVLGGMGAIVWLMLRARRGAFGPQYFTPVDLVGLYWHLVDLIWIFLFPLLYLIR